MAGGESEGEGDAGTGLGLYMSQVLMAAQDGRITVSSRVGQGSRFTLYFPAVAGAVVA